ARLPRLPDDRREDAAFARRELEDARKLRLVREESLVRNALVLAGRVADVVDEAFARRKSGVPPILDPDGIDVPEPKQHVVEARSLTSFRGRTDEDERFVGVVQRRADSEVRAASDEIAERDEELEKDADRIGLRVGRESADDVAGEPAERGVRKRRRPRR